MRMTLLSLLLLTLLSGCQRAEEPTTVNTDTPQAETAGGEDAAVTDPAAETERLNQWLDERFTEELRFSPIELTFLGRKVLYDQIDDMSEAAEREQVAWKEKTVAEMKKNFDYEALSPEGKTSYDLWVYQYERDKAQLPFNRRDYIFHQMHGPQADLPNFLINFHKVDNSDDMRAYITRIGGISRAIDQLLERAKLAAQEGVHPPRFAYEGAIDEATKLIAGAPFVEAGDDTPLWADLKAEIDTLLEAKNIDEKAAQTLRADARKALQESFLPSYKTLIAWLEKDMQKASEEARGASSLPNGEAYYKHRLSRTLTTELSADEIHQIGLSEVARIRAEMETIMKKVGFEGSPQAFFKFVRTDKRFFYPNTDAGRQGYLDDSRAMLDAMKAKLPDYFGILPKADLVVKRVEAFREQPGAAQHYYPGTPDGSRPGVYYAHLADMTAYSKTDMEAIAYHEGIPGHHMQISIAQERTGIPEFRTLSHYTVYAEGWALYAEKLAKEMGGYSDPYSDFGRLTTEIWRAIRLVVDTGLHAKGWSEQQAVDFFLKNSTIPETAVRSEVRRYLVWPGQATAYKIGMLKLLELRTAAREQLGDKFDIRGFHDTVLGGGALPMPVLESRVQRWVREVKQGY
ncbi:MAG: DUF885 domain-containing protein [Exilibacterium sp.]